MTTYELELQALPHDMDHPEGVALGPDEVDDEREVAALPVPRERAVHDDREPLAEALELVVQGDVRRRAPLEQLLG